MKKKLILLLITIIIVSVLAVTLSSCNRASTQGLLANLLSDHSEEDFTYSVYNSEVGAEVGTYSVKIKAFKQGSEITDFGSASSIKVNDGILVRGTLDLSDGTKFETGCYFDLISGGSYMIPKYTFREETVPGKDPFALQGIYDGATLNYTKTVNGVSENGSLSCSGVYYDNNEFHQLLRTITTFSTSLSFGFSVPLVTADEQAVVSLSASCMSIEKITYKGSETDAYKVNISRSTKVAGVSQTLYYSVNELAYNGWGIKNPLLKIEEPFKKGDNQYLMTYTLTDFVIA
ncbi:MAG: hypothetical protein MJ068_03915 [Clostridia bacterium]|nr:hypothetical protein [Clostridia bacterium]